MNKLFSFGEERVFEIKYEGGGESMLFFFLIGVFINFVRFLEFILENFFNIL